MGASWPYSSRLESAHDANGWCAGGTRLGCRWRRVAKPATPPATGKPVVEPGGLLPPAPPATPTQPTTTGQHPAATGQQPPADPAKTAATVQELTKKVEALGKNLTVVTGDEKIKLVLGGAITADFYYNHARPVAPGIPFFLAPAVPVRLQPGHVRRQRPADDASSAWCPAPRSATSSPAGSSSSACSTTPSSSIATACCPIQAYVQLKNDDWRFAAGLQFDVFNPVNPTMLTFSFLGGSGNAGAGFPGQARVERYFHPADDSQITLTVGLSEPISTTVNNNLRRQRGQRLAERGDARVALALGPLQGEGPAAKRPFEAGVSGLVGQIRTTDPTTGRRVVADVWGLGSDFRWAVTPRFGFQGEVFVGPDARGPTPPASCRTSTPITLAGHPRHGRLGRGLLLHLPREAAHARRLRHRRPARPRPRARPAGPQRDLFRQPDLGRDQAPAARVGGHLPRDGLHPRPQQRGRWASRRRCS